MLRWRYHYPQAPFPYQQLIDENARRSRNQPEYELIDTGVFDHGRYWAVDVAYAKAPPTEILAKITIENHAPDEATLPWSQPCGSTTPGGSPAGKSRALYEINT